jgi:hypothetical protein
MAPSRLDAALCGRVATMGAMAREDADAGSDQQRFDHGRHSGDFRDCRQG